jgi:hypothetical protein
MRVLSYRVILKPEPEGGFTVTVPALPGCITFGRDLEEAKKWSRTRSRYIWKASKSILNPSLMMPIPWKPSSRFNMVKLPSLTPRIAHDP